MSEYNIQMNKYNALNAEYDQLYPATKIENVDGLDTALQKKADLDESGKVPAEQVDAYSQSDSISAETRTALSLPETATPDAALAEIARQLSEGGGVKIDLIWENASPNSSFVIGTVKINNIADYDGVFVEFKDNSESYLANATSFVFSKNFSVQTVGFNVYARIRSITITSNGVSFSTAYKYPNNVETQDDSQLVPVKIYGIKGVTSNV